MATLTAEKIVAWLKEKLGEDTTPIYSSKLWLEHDFAFGDTEAGFRSGYTIDYDLLEAEMDAWIAKTFGKQE